MHQDLDFSVQFLYFSCAPMRTTVTLDNQLIRTLQEVSGAQTKAKAVVTAIRDYLQRKQIVRIKQLKGRLKFDLTAEEIRHAER